MKQKPQIDLKAEYIVADLIKKGIKENQIRFHSVGSFLRQYSPDVLEIERTENEESSDEIIHSIILSRDGLYDHLPFGVSHCHNTPRKKFDSEVSRQKILKTREEEQEARKFFQVLEDAFYRLRIRIEQQERSVHLGFTDPSLRQKAAEMWNIDESVFTESQLQNFLSLVPLSSFIVGDMEMTRACLEAALNCPVSIRTFRTPPKEELNNGCFILGSVQLSIDTVLDGIIDSGMPAIELRVGPIAIKELSNYLPDEKGCKVIKELTNFFFSLDLDIKTEVFVDQEYQAFIISDDEYTGRLGYTTRL